MKRFFLLLIFLASTFSSFGQKEANTWHFGFRAGLDFSTNPPQVLQNGRTYSSGGHASISDANGNLLFYIGGLLTTTDSVWNRQHIPMPNGFGYAVSGGMNSAMIIPRPGQAQKYFLFASNIVRNFDFQITYSEVDLALNNGLGNITPAKNVVLLDSTDDQIAAVRHRNNRDFWLIGRKNNSNRYYAYLVSPAGISTTPIISTAGLVMQKCPTCTFKASPDGKLLATVIFTNQYSPNRIQLLNFDPASGSISNGGILPDSASEGLEFSPDGTKLYSTRRTSYFLNLKRYSELVQYDLTLGNTTTIFNNRERIYRMPFVRAALGYMQVAPNGKIYMTGGSTGQYLNVINQPNAQGATCNFTLNAINLGTQSAYLGDKAGLSLPAFIQSYFYKPKIDLQQTCFGDTAFFQLSNRSYVDSVRWNFGNPSAGVSNFSTSFSPKHYYSQPGFYTVKTFIYYPLSTDTLTQQVFIPGPITTPIFGQDTILCQGDTLKLNVYQPGAIYRWSDTLATDSVRLITKPGLYRVELDNGCNTKQDSIYVNFTTPFSLNLGQDQVLCEGETLTLSTPALQATYWWQDHSTASSFTVSKPGVYWVEVQNACATLRDSIVIGYKPTPTFSLGLDTVLCPGEQLVLSPGISNGSYRWQDGSTGKTFKAKEGGLYWVEIELNGCSYADSINVRYQDCLDRLKIPNIITPNQDGRNDFFSLNGILEGNTELQIFNRWGSKIYESRAYQNNWPQQEIPSGTYYYFLRHVPSGAVYKGWVEAVK